MDRPKPNRRNSQTREKDLAKPGDADYVPERIVKLEAKLEVNPYDIEAWNGLIREAQTGSIIKARKTYERLVDQFPTCGRYWKIYIEHEMKTRNFEKVEKLFQRCLMGVLNYDLWKCYLTYVKDTKCGLSSYREKMAQAYDFALDKIGMDIHSFQIWTDYIIFLKSVEAVGSYAENQRITAVRRIYQRGCVNPMIHIEQLWREYCASEQSINPIIAKKMIDDRTRDYLNARRVAKEFETLTRSLQRNIPATPPNPTNIDENKQVELWKRYIDWEKGNAMRSEDIAYISKRVMFAYEQCLLCLGHHPDVWYEATQYLSSTSKQQMEIGDTNSGKALAEEASQLFERAVNGMMRNNILIHFAYADFEEGRMKFDKVHSIYQKLLEIPESDKTLPYIQYMKFARRSDGIKSARAVFKKAREEESISFHVFVAAALMEYYCTKDKQIAFKIFELGLKKFGDQPDYLLCYIDYMSHLNEDNNTRVLFERVLTSGSLTAEKSGNIWDKYLEFESTVGDLTSLVKVEKRRLDAFKTDYEGKITCMIIDRYRFLDKFPCSPAELLSIGYKDTRASVSTVMSSLTTTENLSITKDSADAKANVVKAGCARPDFSQMIPYKPRINPMPGAHIVRGGEFPFPPAACLLLKAIPPPKCFLGPFVIMDDLLQSFAALELPDEKDWIKQMNSETTTESRSRLLDKMTSQVAGVKRPSEDVTTSGLPPAHDIYRARQQKRVR